MNYRVLGAHPFLLEDATSSGIADLRINGAKSLHHVLDEGAVLMKHLDIPMLCKQFDGADLNISRKHQTTLVRDTRTSLCVTVQDAVFEEMMGGKKKTIMVQSGLMPRMLTSFTSHAPPEFFESRSGTDPRACLPQTSERHNGRLQ